MRRKKVFLVIGLLSIGLMAICAGSAYTQQPVQNPSYDRSPATALADTVVTPDDPGLQAPVSNVHWRGGYYGRWSRGPYWRPYRSGFYYYGYRAPRCWWNGFRWVCRPKRIIIY